MRTIKGMFNSSANPSSVAETRRMYEVNSRVEIQYTRGVLVRIDLGVCELSASAGPQGVATVAFASFVAIALVPR